MGVNKLSRNNFYMKNIYSIYYYKYKQSIFCAEIISSVLIFKEMGDDLCRLERNYTEDSVSF